MESSIYQIRNQTNGKRYVGSAVNTQRRWSQHLSRLRRNIHRNPHLQAAFAKYGEGAFAFSVLEDVEDASHLIPREQHYLDTLKPEYNVAPMASNPMLGRRHSEETRAKISKTHKGMYPSKETRAKMSNAQMGERSHNFGKHFSAETRAKMSDAQTGKPGFWYGKSFTEEHRRKLSEAHKAYWCRMRAEHLGNETL